MWRRVRCCSGYARLTALEVGSAGRRDKPEKEDGSGPVANWRPAPPARPDSLRDLLAVLRRSIALAQRRDKAVRNVPLLGDRLEGRLGRPSKALNLEQARGCLGAWIAAVCLPRALAPQRRSRRGGTAPHMGSPLPLDTGRDSGSRRCVALGTQARRHQDQEEPTDHRAAEAGGRRARRTPEVAEAGAGIEGQGLKPNRPWAGLEWTPRELRHSLVSLRCDHGITLEQIALLVGHSSQAATEAVYRKQLRPVITEGAKRWTRSSPTMTRRTRSGLDRFLWPSVWPPGTQKAHSRSCEWASDLCRGGGI